MHAYSSSGVFLKELQSDFSKCERSIMSLAKQISSSIIHLRSPTSNAIAKRLREKSDEVERLQILKNILPHTIDILHISNRIFIMPEIQGLKYQNIHLRSVNDVFADRILPHVPFVIIKTILLQIILCLQAAHSVDPEFCHNDLKLDNILIEEKECSIGNIHFENMIRIVFIDAETVTGTKFPPLSIDAPKELKAEFGLGLEWSEYTDIHLVLLEMWSKIRKTALRQEFQVFLENIMPLPIFDSFQEGNKCLTPRNRLSEKGRAIIKSLQHCGKCLPFQEMHTQSFFSEIKQNVVSS